LSLSEMRVSLVLRWTWALRVLIWTLINQTRRINTKPKRVQKNSEHA
jgi:hypothetical protein